MCFVYTHQVKQAQKRRERIQEQNRELAVKTCELKPRFEEAKSELRQRSTEVDDLRGSYVSKYDELSKEDKFTLSKPTDYGTKVV